MNFNLNLFLEGFRNCLWCGSFRKDLGNPVCAYCFKILEQRYLGTGLNFAEVKGLPTLFLFKWFPDDSFLIKLMTHLKGRKQGLAWEFLAKFSVEQSLVSNQSINFYKRKNKIFVVPPPRVLKSKDHGYFWSMALAKEVGGVMRDCLISIPDGGKNAGLGQKSKSKEERASIEFKTEEVFSNLDEVMFIFADDIITTGSTASAAYFALGCPKNFMVWTLAYRALLV